MERQLGSSERGATTRSTSTSLVCMRCKSFLAGVLDAPRRTGRQRLAASVMQTFPRMVLGMNKMKDRKRAVVAFERQRCGKEEEFAQQEADKALAEIDAKLNKKAKDVRKLLKEASKELVARAKSTQIEAGPSPWDDEAAQEVPVFTEPLPPIHVPPNQKPGWCSRRVAPEEPSSPQPANAAKMAAPPPVAPSTPRWRPNLTPRRRSCGLSVLIASSRRRSRDAPNDKF